MIADPLTLRNATTSSVYDLVSTVGSKTIRQKVSGLNSQQLSATLTVSHDQNDKTKRKRSVLRIDTTYLDGGSLGITESAAVYLVIDRPWPSVSDPTYTLTKAALAEILAFFATDPTAATPGSVPYAISTTLGVKLINGEP